MFIYLLRCVKSPAGGAVPLLSGLLCAPLLLPVFLPRPFAPRPLAAATPQQPPAVPDSPPGDRRPPSDPHPQQTPPDPSILAASAVPAWAADAIFYQIFPERFRNGDPDNDPTRASLEDLQRVPRNWRISPWTGDWYARDPWERQLGDHFYEHGVFDRRYGGDLQGILDKLDYLADLGINTVYLNPVFYARSLHKYDGASMHHIDPYFGPDPRGDLQILRAESADPATWRWTAADQLFLKLIDQLHRRGIRVILDGVFNHTGRDFFAFADLRTRQQQSDYRDWYEALAWDDPTTEANEFRYRCWWGIDTLPEFANAADGSSLAAGPKEYVFAITRRWMDPNGDGDPRDGIDGWRLDVANEVPDGFWQPWHTLVRSINPQAYTSAEIWTDAAAYLDRCQFSASMNYHAFAFPVKGFLVDGRLSASAFGQLLNARREELPGQRQFAMMNLLDSHDTDRLASMIVNGGKHTYLQPDRFDYDVGERVSPRQFGDYDVTRPDRRHRQIQALCVFLQMTYVGAPMIYYGSEVGMWGADDPDSRMPMVWDDLSYADQQTHPDPARHRRADSVAVDPDLAAIYRAAIALRKRLPALRRGSFRILATDDSRQLLLFERALADQVVVVALNRSDSPVDWTIPYDPPAGEETREPLVLDSGRSRTADTAGARATIRDHGLQLQIPALTGMAVVWE